MSIGESKSDECRRVIVRLGIACLIFAVLAWLLYPCYDSSWRVLKWKAHNLGIKGQNMSYDTNTRLILFEQEKKGSTQTRICTVDMQGRNLTAYADGVMPCWVSAGTQFGYSQICGTSYVPELVDIHTGKRTGFKGISAIQPVVWYPRGMGFAYRVIDPHIPPGFPSSSWLYQRAYQSGSRPVLIGGMTCLVSQTEFSFHPTKKAWTWTEDFIRSGSIEWRVQTKSQRYGQLTADPTDPSDSLSSDESCGHMLGFDTRHPAGHSSWHPRDLSFVYDNESAIWSQNCREDTQTRLWPRSFPSFSADDRASFPVYSPSGDRVAFLLKADSGQTSIVCMNLDTGSVETAAKGVKIPAGRKLNTTLVTETGASHKYDGRPFAWADNGRAILYTNTAGEICVAENAGN